MELIKLAVPESLITEIVPEVSDLASFLDIPHGIEKEDDHIYMHVIGVDSILRLSSFRSRRESDVMVSTHVFCEIIMDIKSGMPVLEAFNKQGYTY